MKRYQAIIALQLILIIVFSGCTNIKPHVQQYQTYSGVINNEGMLLQAEASQDQDLSAGRIILGFYTGEKSSQDSMLAHLSEMNSIAFFWYSFDVKGNVNAVGNTDLNIKKAAQKGGVKALALVNNLTGKVFDPELTHQVLGNPAIRSDFISNLLALTTEGNWDGLIIDIEKTLAVDRNSYSEFISELQRILKTKGKVLYVTIPAKFHDDPNDLWSGAYDYTAIGQAADQVVLMTYEEHGLGTTQGAIASLGWLTRVISYAIGLIPKQKIIMGLPVYAYDWTSDKPTLPIPLSLPKAADLARENAVEILYDESQKVPHYTFTSTGIRHEVYMENTHSLTAKLDVAQKNRLQGIAIWRLGLEDPTFWEKVLPDYKKSQ